MGEFGHSRGVLVVEDDVDIRDAITLMLQDEGFEVAVASNGQEALQLLRQDIYYCLIFLDLWMPVMDGFKFRALQQQHPELAAIPIVVISADQAVRQRAEDLQAAAYIKKPPKLHDILTVLDQYC